MVMLTDQMWAVSPITDRVTWFNHPKVQGPTNGNIGLFSGGNVTRYDTSTSWRAAEDVEPQANYANTVFGFY
jgi:hypothetical protein